MLVIESSFHESTWSGFLRTVWLDNEVVVTLPGGNVEIPDTQPERLKDEVVQIPRPSMDRT